MAGRVTATWWGRGDSRSQYSPVDVVPTWCYLTAQCQYYVPTRRRTPRSKLRLGPSLLALPLGDGVVLLRASPNEALRWELLRLHYPLSVSIAAFGRDLVRENDVHYVPLINCFATPPDRFLFATTSWLIPRMVATSSRNSHPENLIREKHILFVTQSYYSSFML